MDVQLKIVLGKDKGRLLNFGAGEYVFGRGMECHVRPDSPMVSRQHCLLRIEGKTVWLRDLGSAHGTLVNDTLLTTERSLQNGDQVQLGPLVLEVVLPNQALLATLHASTALSDTIPG